MTANPRRVLGPVLLVHPLELLPPKYRDTDALTIIFADGEPHFYAATRDPGRLAALLAQLVRRLTEYPSACRELAGAPAARESGIVKAREDRWSVLRALFESWSIDDGAGA